MKPINLSSSPSSTRQAVVVGAARSWPGVYAIALGAMALVITEFLPVGLLTGISSDLGIGEAAAGLLVSTTAVLGFIAAPLTALLIGRTDRRHVLLGLTGLLVLSSALSSVANSFLVLLFARVVLGVGVGGFWAIAVTAAAKLVPPEKVHAASSIVFAGISIGAVVSVPTGSYLAAHSDWRFAFMGATALAIVVFLLQLAILPSLKMASSVKLRDIVGLFKDARVRTIFLAMILIVSGQYAGYTFITPYLGQVTQVGANLLSPLLLGYGVVTVVGNFVGGAASGCNLGQTVTATVWIFMLALAGVAISGQNVVFAAISLAFWSLAWGMAPVATQLWLFKATPWAPEAAQAMNTSVFQLAIGLGSLAGSYAVDRFGLGVSPWIGAAILVLAAAAVAWGIRLGRTASAARNPLFDSNATPTR